MLTSMCYLFLKDSNLKRCLCWHVAISSFLLLRVPKCCLQIIKYFSARHRWHFLLMFVYALHFFKIFHEMSYCTLSPVSFQMYLLSSVSVLKSGFLNDLLCIYSLVLNGFFVAPMYVSVLLLSCLVTVAWYTISWVKHCPSIGQLSPVLQLHFLASVSWLSVLLRMRLLWLFTIVFMLERQL